jgi:hypothetical protein
MDESPEKQFVDLLDAIASEPPSVARDQKIAVLYDLADEVHFTREEWEMLCLKLEKVTTVPLQ